MQISLAANIDLTRAPKTDEERHTVRELKTALNRLGWYTPDPDVGMNDDIDGNFKDAVYAFQRKSAIFHDDVDLGPGSTTERMLNEELDYMERDYLFSGSYIWRTVGDDKVRSDHAARNGRKFSWDDPPEGGHAGEDYNCRCWAEPVVAPYHPWIEWVNERREERLAQSSTIERLTQPKGLNEPLITSVPLDAINPTISPLDFIGWGAVAGVKIANRAIVAEIARRQALQAEKIISPLKGPYEIALEGGKHAGTLQKYRNVSNKELEKGIKSFDKQINRHLEKIKNPEKEYPDFKNLDKRRQKNLLEKRWPSDIKRLEEQKEILRRILDEKN